MKALLAVSALLLAGCAGTEPDTTATVSGIVTIGPVPGPCVAGTPCSRPAGGVKLVFSRSGGSPVEVSSDEQGRYEVTLSRGRYRIRVPNHPPPATISPTSVTVANDQRLDITIDSGVRGT